MAETRGELPRWLWLWTPLAVFVIPYVVRLAAPADYERWIKTEYGFIENATALFLAVSVVTGVLVFRRARELPFAWLAPCVLCFTIGAFYFLGEELSWGQHLFGWRTPEALAGINDQRETNLHNIGGLGGLTESLLDQAPRLLLTIAAAVAGVMMPLAFARTRGTWDPRTSARYWIWPSRVVVLAALLALFARVPGKIAGHPGDKQTVWNVHGGESKECFLALFMMLAILALLVRTRRYPRARPATPAGETAEGVPGGVPGQRALTRACQTSNPDRPQPTRAPSSK